MKSSIILFMTLAIIAHSKLSLATKFEVCDQSKLLAEVKDVRVSDCELLKDEACPFLRGFNKSIELDFVPTKRIEQVKVKIAGKLSKLPVPFHVNPDEACGNYGFDCPLEPGKQYTFKLSLPILRGYPKTNVNVFLRLVEENGDVISCIEMPARIQEPQKETI